MVDVRYRVRIQFVVDLGLRVRIEDVFGVGLMLGFSLWLLFGLGIGLVWVKVKGKNGVSVRGVVRIGFIVTVGIGLKLGLWMCYMVGIKIRVGFGIRFLLVWGMGLEHKLEKKKHLQQMVLGEPDVHM